jgi:hypothetical protein
MNLRVIVSIDEEKETNLEVKGVKYLGDNQIKNVLELVRAQIEDMRDELMDEEEDFEDEDV